MFWLIGTLISGLLVGLVAKFVMPGKDPGGIVGTMLIGNAGSFIGSWVGGFLGWGSTGFLMSVVGAILLLIGYRVIAAKKV